MLCPIVRIELDRHGGCHQSAGIYKSARDPALHITVLLLCTFVQFTLCYLALYVTVLLLCILLCYFATLLSMLLYVLLLC